MRTYSAAPGLALRPSSSRVRRSGGRCRRATTARSWAPASLWGPGGSCSLSSRCMRPAEATPSDETQRRPTSYSPSRSARVRCRIDFAVGAMLQRSWHIGSLETERRRGSQTLSSPSRTRVSPSTTRVTVRASRRSPQDATPSLAEWYRRACCKDRGTSTWVRWSVYCLPWERGLRSSQAEGPQRLARLAPPSSGQGLE